MEVLVGDYDNPIGICEMRPDFRWGFRVFHCEDESARRVMRDKLVYEIKRRESVL
jgi:hypothetical protein